MKVLFINNNKQTCGVYQYGVRLFNILNKSKKIQYIYKEIICSNSYNNILIQYNDISSIIYNYHPITMLWLSNNTIQKNKNIKNICIYHECILKDILFFDIKLNINPLFFDNNKHFGIPRPIFNNIDNFLDIYIPSNKNIQNFIDYYENDTPIFGSFGFGFDTKGFHRIINLINNNFDKAIIKLVIPIEHNSPYDIKYINYCKNIVVKKNIKVIFSHHFFTNEDILKFLYKNDMNIFLYDYDKLKYIENAKIGVSSVIDYAISVKKPIGISNSLMFNHIYNDKICLYKTPINICMNESVQYYSKFLNDYSDSNINNIFENIILT